MARRVTLSADEGDDVLAAAIGDTRRLSVHQKRVVLRLRRGDADGDVPWITEIVCFLFNAQGEVLRIHRADGRSSGTAPRPVEIAAGGQEYEEEDPITIRCVGSKEAVEKQRMTLLLDELDSAVEVVGFVVSYTTDHIARRPHLNAFDVTCDVTADMDDDPDDAEIRVASSLRRETVSPHDLHYIHDRPTESSANYVVLCKIYRDTDSRNDWIFHSISAKGEVRSSVSAALAEAMQVFLLDIIPEIEIAHRNALNTVGSICAALSRAEVLEMEEYFRDEGVSCEAFTKLLLLVLLKSRPELRRLSRVTSLVALLFEMFEQIDINGDGTVDWEEFTTFCVSLGLIATNEQQLGGSEATKYSYRQQLVGPSSRTFPYQIRRIRPLPAIRLIAVVQNKCSAVLMYDMEMSFLYEFTHVSRLCREDNVALAILDLDYVVQRNWLVVSSSDHTLTFWSVVNAITGAYVYAFKIGSRCPIPNIQWCGNVLNRLFTVSSEGVQLWDIDAKRVAGKLSHHRDRITACVEIQAETPMLATCSFDGTIAVLQVPTLSVAFQLTGHVQGILHMDYHQPCGLLLSSGFEHQAYCWSVPNKCLMTTLGGHQASLIGARFVSNLSSTTSVMVVVGDERGHFRLWDVTRCYGGHSTDLATAIHSFDIVTPNLCKFRAFGCLLPPPSRKKHGQSQDLCDIISGSFRLYRFHAVTHSDESAPPRHVTFNSVSSCFVGSVDGTITVWSGNSGSKLEEPIIIRNVDVCAVVFDQPRQRKLFVATSDGSIRLYNPITAMMLTRSEVHDGYISSLIYCARSSCLISTGHDRRISVAYSSTGKTDIEVLRYVENAHGACITTAAYSTGLELIATGDEAGNVHVYDFQRLYLLFRCDGHADDIRALHFHYSAPILFSGDAAGVAYVWHVSVPDTSYQIRPMMQLTLACNNFFMTEVRPSSVSGSRNSRPATAISLPSSITSSPITSIVCSPESKHATSSYVYMGTVNGAIWGWDFRALTNHARSFGVGKAFEYRFHGDDALSDTGSKYNALLRVKHKTSVLKLRSEDTRTPITFEADRLGKEGSNGMDHVVLQSCEASCVWQAHTSHVSQLQLLPYPGQMCSVSLDGTIKVWDTAHTCLGTINTIADLKTNKGGRDILTPSNGTGSSSTWKFSYYHHMVNDSRDKHVLIGREMLQRVKRKLKKEQEKLHRSKMDMNVGGSSEETVEESELRVAQIKTPQLTPMLEAAEKLLATQIAFSKESRRVGMQRGLYGAEEVRLLRELAQGPRKQLEQQVKSRLAPLMLASPKPEGPKKSSKMRPQGNELELPVMRSMRHFSVEIERRRAAEKRASAHFVIPDTSLSPFLREKLMSPDGAPSPKSTPKKRLPIQSLSLKMDTRVVVMEDADDGPGAMTEISTPNGLSRRRLTSYASAPCFPVAQSTSTSLLSKSSSSVVAGDEREGEKDAFRTNIERKIRIYEGLGVTRSQTNTDESDSFVDKGKLDQQTPSRQHPGPSRHKPQPLLSDRQRVDGDSSREFSNSRKRLSQGLVSTPAVSSSSGNPYGPHYTSKQVVDFSGILARFDSDCSGDIDKSEWVRMMQSCRPIFGASDLEAAERLFHSIDRDDSGKISLQEILPMVFSKATPDQLQKMRQSIQSRIDAAAAAMAAGKAASM